VGGFCCTLSYMSRCQETVVSGVHFRRQHSKVFHRKRCHSAFSLSSGPVISSQRTRFLSRYHYTHSASE